MRMISGLTPLGWIRLLTVAAPTAPAPMMPIFTAASCPCSKRSASVQHPRRITPSATPLALCHASRCLAFLQTVGNQRPRHRPAPRLPGRPATDNNGAIAHTERPGTSADNGVAGPVAHVARHAEEAAMTGQRLVVGVS